MDKNLVKWSDGRSKGTTSWVKKSAVKKGTIAVGKKVVVAWGKSKKTYKAEVIDDGVRSSENPPQDDNEESCTFTPYYFSAWFYLGVSVTIFYYLYIFCMVYL